MECVISTESTDSNVITAVDEPTVLPSAIGSDWVRVAVSGRSLQISLATSRDGERRQFTECNLIKAWIISGRSGVESLETTRLCVLIPPVVTKHLNQIKQRTVH